MNKITYIPIGVIRTPFKEPKNVPIQAAASKDTSGTIEICPQYVEGLKDLDGFSHIILLYHFHLVTDCSLMVKPFLDDKLHGIFATRAPARPNKIGFSVVKLKKIEQNVLFVENLDIVDGTPLLDIKPYVPKFDHRETVEIGWFSSKINKLPETRDDGRFCK
ncbi:MAG: tRNA (N6-threonylcarbamoyladenosine(37)-N6)-methyltransferase TrmO [Candidatus Bathyarchaeota archaeon]|nr:tRNA (N6-threonylcarbamoyladenosine(37)-N6)-methyltransferase TrmO [Candidatus Bathyarchaeota archaeon]